MEILKKIIISTVFIATCTFSVAQRADSKKIIQAFQQSYISEEKGDFSSAITDLKQVYTDDSYEINLRMGWLLYSEGQNNESVKYYTKAINLKPFAIEPKFGLCYPLSSLGKWNTLIPQYNKILKISPNNSTAIYKLGLIYYNKKNYIAAEKYLEKMVNLFPFDYDGLNLLGWTKFQLKKYREAKILFSKALMNTPNGTSAKEGLLLLKN